MKKRENFSRFVFLSIDDHENNNEDVQTDSSELIVPSTEQQSASPSVPSNTCQVVENETSTIVKPSTRPAILLKRIPLNEAEQYLPAAYRIRKEYHLEKKTPIFSSLQRNPNVEENVKIKIHHPLSLNQRK